ncbi:hypothetical protein CXF87_09655 [Halomonas sp. MES3-P3E]|nr:hypothetical protein CXF87_09655 [Halomonas sp. MES3-P3E]
MAQRAKGIAWEPFQHPGGEAYCLDHLHPECVEYVIPPAKNAPERRFQVAVSYGLHCFTRTPREGEAVDDAEWYSDSREKRVFCLERWQLSKMLPEVVRTLGNRKCLHTGREEFVTLKVVEEGRTFDYAIFFIVSKSNAPGIDMNLFIVSAHERFNALKYTKPIRFGVILMNRYQGKKIRPPR